MNLICTLALDKNHNGYATTEPKTLTNSLHWLKCVYSLQWRTLHCQSVTPEQVLSLWAALTSSGLMDPLSHHSWCEVCIEDTGRRSICSNSTALWSQAHSCGQSMQSWWSLCPLVIVMTEEPLLHKIVSLTK